jgi:multiple RNA-binding domain-containing protein 1
LPRAWSRYSKGSSLYDKAHPVIKGSGVAADTGAAAAAASSETKPEKSAKAAKAEKAADPRVREFLEVMRPRTAGKLWANDEDTEQPAAAAAPPRPKRPAESDSEHEAPPAGKASAAKAKAGGKVGKKKETAAADDGDEHAATAMDVDVPAAAAAASDDDGVWESGRLFVRNLPFSITEDELERLFAPFGDVSDVRVWPSPRAVCRPSDGRCRCTW